jgi:succinoglycan biosynthesis transport protein ExoP
MSVSDPKNYPSNQKQLIDYWRVLTRYKWAIFSVAIIGGLIGLMIAATTSPVYRAQTRILVEHEKKEVLNERRPQRFNLTAFFLTQIELLRSTTLARELVERLELQKLPEFSEKPKSMVFDLLASLAGAEKAAELMGQSTEETKSDSPMTDTVRHLQKNLSVQSGRHKGIIVVGYDSYSPQTAAAVANEITALYIRAVEKQQETNVEENIQWLTEQLNLARSKLVESEAELQGFQRSSDLGGSKDVQSASAKKLNNIMNELLAARSQRASTEIALRQVKELPKKTTAAYLGIKNIEQDSNVRETRSLESKAMRNINELSERYGEKHPKMIAARAELRSIRKKLALDVRRASTSLQNEFQLAVAKEKEIAKVYEQMKRESNVLKGKVFDLAKLEMDVATNREIYDMLLTRVKEADLNKDSERVIVKVIDPAAIPASPYKPDLKKIVSKWLMIGLLIGVILAFLRDSMDTTMKTGEDLKERLGLNVLGIFPVLSRRDLDGFRPERVIAEKPRSGIAESFNNIRTNIIFSAANEPPQVIAVTSAVASEGKTTISSNLGIAMARLGPTLILELDTRKPRFVSLIKGRHRAGIFEFVSGKASLKESVVVDKRVKNLYTLPVVGKPAKPLEFLSSRRFADSLALLRKKFKYIILDTPPILPVSDTIVLAPLVDGIVMVVAAEKTKHPAAREALIRLQQVNAEVLGSILSMGNPRTLKAYGQGHYYGYSYYHYYDDRKKAAV